MSTIPVTQDSDRLAIREAQLRLLAAQQQAERLDHQLKSAIEAFNKERESFKNVITGVAERLEVDPSKAKFNLDTLVFEIAEEPKVVKKVKSKVPEPVTPSVQ